MSLFTIIKIPQHLSLISGMVVENNVLLYHISIDNFSMKILTENSKKNVPIFYICKYNYILIVLPVNKNKKSMPTGNNR